MTVICIILIILWVLCSFAMCIFLGYSIKDCQTKETATKIIQEYK